MVNVAGHQGEYGVILVECMVCNGGVYSFCMGESAIAIVVCYP